ncbi:MAG: aspartate/glutamate racemase family protein, partial [Pseudomonadota bacterium]
MTEDDMKPVIVTPKPNDEREDQFQNQGNILVVNPNSNPRVTAAISGAASRFRLGGGPSIECIDIPGAPFGIESQRDSDRVAPYLARLAAEREGLAGFVIACFCDPGLVGCREAVSYPVWGMGESA